MNKKTILSLEGVSAGYGEEDVISDISFSLTEGEILCFVGQSGCGKSTLLKSIIGTFDKPTVSCGEITFDSRRLSECSVKQRSRITTTGIGYIFQTPGAAFNPIRSYKKQFIETLGSHGKYKKETFMTSAQTVFSRLGLDDAERILDSCPYEMSGGMNQRIALALVILMQQKLLLADEPTSALDSVSRRLVADELKMLSMDYGMSQIIVTHDIALAAYISDSIAVMHGGKMIELAPTAELISAPAHSYTKMLLNAVPTLGNQLPTVEPDAASFSGRFIECSPGHFACEEI